MSHELATAADGKVMMAYAGETPWHGLGKVVSNDLTPDQMLHEAGLDWEVKKYKASIRIGDKTIPTGQYGLVRTSDNKLLTNISKDWEPCQNSDAFDFFADFVAAGHMEMHTAGALKDGQIVWALAKTTSAFTVFKKDVVESFLLFTNPHIYGRSIDIRFTAVRVVCNNTLTAALDLAAKTKVSIAHRHKFDPDKAKELLGLADYKMTKYKAAAEFLGSKRYTVEAMSEYFDRMFPQAAKAKKEGLTKQASRALEIVETQPGGEYAPGTWWNAYNAVTWIVDHEMGRDNDNRLTSAWYGGGAKRKLNALVTAKEFAEAA
jgi:phage/plasmid-like protein (TIGR03299 family)